MAFGPTTCAKERECTNNSIYSLCAPWYTVENYSKTYASLLHHVPDSRYYPEYNESVIVPPEVRRLSNRLPYVRIHDTMDEKREGHIRNRYSNCKQLGHNKAGCPNPPAQSSFTG